MEAGDPSGVFGPIWVEDLEARLQARSLKRKLGHEFGAGAPCLQCNLCSGLDLHYWRKTCKSCSCKQDEHDIEDDDVLRFKLLFKDKDNAKKYLVVNSVVKLRLEDTFAVMYSPVIHQSAEEAKVLKPMKFDWIPTNVSESLASAFFNELPVGMLPIMGSHGAKLRRLNMKLQTPMHDLVPEESLITKPAAYENYLKKLRDTANIAVILRVEQQHQFHRSTPWNTQSSCYTGIVRPMSTLVPNNKRFKNGNIDPVTYNTTPRAFRASAGATQRSTFQRLPLAISSTCLKVPSSFVPSSTENKAGPSTAPFGVENQQMETYSNIWPSNSNMVIAPFGIGNQRMGTDRNSQPSHCSNRVTASFSIGNQMGTYRKNQLINSNRVPYLASEEVCKELADLNISGIGVLDGNPRTENLINNEFGERSLECSRRGASTPIGFGESAFSPCQTVREMSYYEPLDFPPDCEGFDRDTRDVRNPNIKPEGATGIPDFSKEVHVRYRKLKCAHCESGIEFGSVAVFVKEGGPDLAWHPYCFVCQTCRTFLVDMVYFFKEGKVYCARHFAETLGLDRCSACDELIFAKQFTFAEGKTYHTQHFCCFDCEIQLANREYMLNKQNKNAPTCMYCYENNWAKKCFTCAQAIRLDDQAITFSSVHWHNKPACFKCYVCGLSLVDGRCLWSNTRPYCSQNCRRIGEEGPWP